MRLIFASFLSVLSAAPVFAEPYRAVNRLFVVPLSADTFEVIEDRGAGARGIWCAAADYTQAIGRDVPRQRMFVLQPRGPSVSSPGRKGIVFTLRPDETIRDTPSSYSVSVTRKGENLAVSHADQFCQSLIEELFDRF